MLAATAATRRSFFSGAAYVERAGGIALATYADAAVSGANTSARPQYQALLRDAEAGMFDCILAEDIDRYARDTEESARLLKRMAFRNIEVHTVHGKAARIDGALKGSCRICSSTSSARKPSAVMVGAFERGGIPSGLCYGYRAGARQASGSSTRIRRPSSAASMSGSPPDRRRRDLPPAQCRGRAHTPAASYGEGRPCSATPSA